MKTKVKWLNRSIATHGPYLTLCTSEEQFILALKQLKLATNKLFVSNGALATLHTFTHDKEGIICIVCIDKQLDRKPSEIVGTLVHEAVHVWQEYISYIGEDSPGKEQEAYAIQAISQELVQSYSDQLSTNNDRR